jgi:cell division septation protein DedD
LPQFEASSIADNELVLEVRLDNLILSDGVLGYQKGGGVLLPLGQMMSALDFAITTDPEAGTAEGWFLSEDRRFHLDVARHEAQVGGRTSAVPPESIEVRADDIYVDSALFAAWFPLEVKLSLSDLAVLVEPRVPLPIQERLKREGRRARMNSSGEEPANLPVLVTPYQPLSWPFIDTSLFAGRDSRISGRQYNYTTFLTGDLAYLGTRLAVSGNQSDPFTNVRLSAGRDDPRGELLGPLHATEFEIGDVFAPQIPLVSTQIEGRGLLLSNQPLDRPTEYDRTTLRGDLPLGWDVELYRNDALLDTRTSSADGRYEFPGVPLLYGTNTLRLVFYGPQGQKREQIQRIQIGANLLRPGERRYRLAVNQQSRPTIEVGRQRFGNIEEPGEARFTAEYELGLTKRLSISTGFASLGLKQGRRNYLNLGLRGSALRTFFVLDGSLDQDRRSAARALLQTGLGAISVSGEHSQFFDGFISERTEQIANPLDRHSELRFDGGTTLKFLPRLSYSLAGRLDHRTDGQSDLAIDERVSTFVRGVSFSNSLSYQRQSGTSFAPSETVRGTALGNARLGQVGIRGDIGYELKPEERLNDGALTLDYSLSEETLGRATLSHEFAGSELTTVALGLFRTFPNFSLGAAATYADDGEYSVGLSASFGLGREPREGSFAMSPRGVASDGAVSALVFLDRDQDGKFGTGDQTLPGVRFAGRERELTDRRGVAFLQGVPANRAAPIAIDPSSLEDPYWAPASEGYAVIGRAGRVARAEFPVTATGEVSGKVFLMKGEFRQEIASVELELLDPAGAVVRKVKSEFDGYYSLGGVRPGHYRLRVSPTQAERLKFSPPADQPIEVGPDGGPVQAPDMLLVRTGAPLLAASSPAPAPVKSGAAQAAREERPSRVARAQTQATGEVSGKVFLSEGPQRHEIASVELELLDRVGAVVKTATSEFDGYYALGGVRPGQYALRVSPAQAVQLKFSAPAAQSIEIGSAGGPVHAPDMLLARASAPLLATSAPAPTNSGAALPANAGRARIQLAAVTDEGKAREGWARLRDRAPDLLQALKIEIESVAWNSQTGRLYRLRAGPFPNLATARQMCDQLKARGVSCFLVSG